MGEGAMPWGSTVGMACHGRKGAQIGGGSHRWLGWTWGWAHVPSASQRIKWEAVYDMGFVGQPAIVLCLSGGYGEIEVP
jgi:hypothetical protein